MSTEDQTAGYILERLKMGNVQTYCHQFFQMKDIGDMTLEEIYDNIMNSSSVKAFIDASKNKAQAKWNVHAIIAWNFRMWIDGK